MNLSRLKNILAILISTFAVNTHANERWFEIELVIFAHDNDTEKLSEKFSDTISPININNARDLISSRFPQTGEEALRLLPQCEDLPAITDEASPDLALFTHPEQLKAQTFWLDEQPRHPELNSPKNNVFTDDTAFIDQNEIALVQNGQHDIESTRIDQGVTVSELNEQINPSPEYTKEEAPIEAEDINLFQQVSLLKKAAWQTGGLFNHCRQTFPSAIFTEGKVLREIQNKIYWSDIPLRLSAIENTVDEQPYLLSDASLQFKKEVQKLMWRNDIKPLLHLGWRQPVKSERREKPWRLFTGDNYSRDYEYAGEPIIKNIDLPTETLPDPTIAQTNDENVSLAHQNVVSNIQDLLSKIETGQWQVEKAQWQDKVEKWQAKQISEAVPDQVWSFDGLFKIYLRHYLYIETEFNIRKVGPHPLQLALQDEINQHYENQSKLNLPIDQSYNEEIESRKETIPASYLYAYPFKQNRRIRSGEIHYFDHPLMGIMLQVRKYTPRSPAE